MDPVIPQEGGDGDRPGDPGGLGDRILFWPQVKAMTGLSRSTIWRMQKVGEFPESVQISRGRVGWWESELTVWKRARTPHRLPEPRPFEPSSKHPGAEARLAGRRPAPIQARAPAAPSAAPSAETTREPALDPPAPRDHKAPRDPANRSARARRARAQTVSADQIAFDFGP